MALFKRKRAIALWTGAGILTLGVAGCAIRPLPENVARASTFDIVERIRCEVVDGLKDFENTTDWEKTKKIMTATAIGYDFDFQVEEKNAEKSGRLEFKRPAFNGEGKGFFLDLSGGVERERKNTRSFRIVDNLGDLVKERRERCARTLKTADGLYPIAGATGMAEVVRTYVKLELLTDLPVSADIAQSEVFSDELKFVTRFTAGVAPKIELSTVAGQFRLSHASLTGEVTRDETHSVTIALSRGPGDVDMARILARTVGVTPQDFIVTPFKGEPLIRPYRTVRRLIASRDPIAERRVIYELQRRRDAREENRAVNRILRGTD